MPVGASDGGNSVEEKERKNRETGISSLPLMLAALVVPATATPN